MSRGEDNWNGEPRCEKQRLEEPPGSGEPLHTIFEEYADDQAAWMRDYVPAMEKMLANGYETGLVDAPDFTTGVRGPAICICTFSPFFARLFVRSPPEIVGRSSCPATRMKSLVPVLRTSSDPTSGGTSGLQRVTQEQSFKLALKSQSPDPLCNM